MKIPRIILLLAMLLPLQALATHSSAAAYRNVLTGVTAHTLTFSTVVDHETLIACFVDRTGGAVINSVADGASGTWTQRSTHTDATFLVVCYVREDAAAATNLVVTFTSNASQNSQVVGIRVATDAGGSTYPTYNAVATPIVNADSTNSDSNTVTLSAGGSLVGVLSTAQTQGTAPTVDVGDSIGPAGGAGVRSFMAFDAQAASGTYGFETTLAATSVSRWQVISFIDSGAPPASGLLLRRRRN